MKKISIIITGPTAVGKTDLVEKLMQLAPTQFVMVNADLGQFYRPLNIGTAKPLNLNDYSNELFNVLNEPVDWNIASFRKTLKEKLEKIWEQKKIPILVGGSGFYIKAFFFDNAQVETVNELSQDYKVLDNLDLWTKLYEIDPSRAEAISKNDRYRIERALQIWENTGTLPSLYESKFEPLSDFMFIYATLDRPELYERINKRILIMFEQGWIDEVANLNEQWKEFLLKKKIIGYPEIIHYLESKNQNFDFLVAEVSQKTRNYAKRQITFLKVLKKQLAEALDAQVTLEPEFFGTTDELSLTFAQIDLYIEELIKKIGSYLND